MSGRLHVVLVLMILLTCRSVAIMLAQQQMRAIAAPVVITAEPPRVIDAQNSVVAHDVTVDEIDPLPKDRRFQSIAVAMPSVNFGDVEGVFHVNGASGAENLFEVDGLNTTNAINGALPQSTVLEYIREVQVKTTGIPAEYGGALGGVISAVTKSGGNIFTGEGHYYLDGSPLSARPVKRLVLNPDDDRTVRYIHDEKPSDIRQELGGAIGGPIVRDRLFFFASLSPRVGVRANEYTFSSGTDLGEIERTSKVIQAFGKVTAGNRRVNAYVSALGTPTYVTGTLPAYNGSGPNWISSSKAGNEANKERGWEQMQATVNGNVDIVVSDRAYAGFRGGMFQDRYSDTGASQSTNYTYQRVASAALGIPASLRGAIGTQNTPRVLITDFDATKRRFFNADYNHTLHRGGLHTLKGGFEYQHTLNDVSSLYPGGYVDIFWGETLVLGGQPADRGLFGYYAVNNRGTNGRAGASIISLFVQDQWQIANRLTLNLGIRTEAEKVPSFRQEIREHALDFGFGEKVAPRLGFSYDPLGNGRAKVYASYGRYFDWTKYALPRGSFGGDRWCIFYRSIDDPSAPLSANLSNMPGRDLWLGSGNCRNRRVPSLQTIDRDIKPMSQDSYSAGFEFEVNPGTVATIHYVHNDLNRAIENLGALVRGNEVYLIGNPGEGGADITPTSFAPLTPAFETPGAKRVYDAIELGMTRRLANNWSGSANLTISRLWGNYAGPASGQGDNVNRGWDSDEQMFDAYGNLDPVGRLATDRPVVLKLYGAYNIQRNTQIGAFIYAGSGTPTTTFVHTVHQKELFVEGRGDMGRTPFFSKTDLLVSHELTMNGSKRLRFELNVLNLFNQKTARHIFNHLNRGAGAPRSASAIDLHEVDLLRGYDYNAILRATPDGADAYDPRYGIADLFQDGTRGQFLVKFLF